MTNIAAVIRLAPYVPQAESDPIAMSLYRNHSIAPEQLLTLATNVLQQAFFRGSRLDAKRRYQFLDGGRTIFLLKLRLEDGSELEVNLRLDRSEQRGKLNFSAFRQLVGQLVVECVDRLNKKQPLNLFANAEQQRTVFMIPAAQQADDVVDMLVLAVELSQPGALLLELMFIDPGQFAQQGAA
jgi:hypothetical protein